MSALRRTVIVGLALGLVPLGGCAESETLTRPCMTTLQVGGFWNAAWKCTGDLGTCIAGTHRLEVVQVATDLTAVAATIVASSDPAQVGGTLSGELCDATLTWSGEVAGVDRSGVYVYSDADNLTLTATYTDGGEAFTCSGTGTREPLAAPPGSGCP